MMSIAVLYPEGSYRLEHHLYWTLLTVGNARPVASSDQLPNVMARKTFHLTKAHLIIVSDGRHSSCITQTE